MKLDYQKLSEAILGYLGGKDNLESYTNCMTRLRVYPKDKTKVNFVALKAMKEVMGVVDAEQLQIILGPGHAQTVKEIIDDLLLDEEDVATDQLERKLEEKPKSLQAFLQKIGSIFVPLIPYFIIYGFLALIPAYLKFYVAENNSLFAFFISLKELSLYVLVGLIGYSGAKEFLAQPSYGAFLAIIIFAVSQSQFLQNMFNSDMAAFLASGSIPAIIFGCIVLKKVEDFFKKRLPQLLSFYLLPILTIIVTIIVSIIIILPIASILMSVILWFIENILLQKLGALGGFILSLLFLPTVILGIHQVLYPLHIQILIENQGNFLFPILATAGAGQLGAAFALYVIEKLKHDKQKIKAVIPASFLGMNEQLIYGITHPRFYPFVTGCIGGAFGGAYLGYLYQQGNAVLSATIGPSGLLMIPYILNYQWLNYIIALIISYGCGFILTLCFGRKKRLTKK